MSAEGHSPNDSGQCKVRNTDLAIPNVELASAIESMLEYAMGGLIGKQYGAACMVWAAELCTVFGLVRHSEHTASGL